MSASTFGSRKFLPTEVLTFLPTPSNLDSRLSNLSNFRSEAEADLNAADVVDLRILICFTRHAWAFAKRDRTRYRNTQSEQTQLKGNC